MSPRRIIATTSGCLFVLSAALEILNASVGWFYQHLTPLNLTVTLPEAALWLLAAFCLFARPTWGWFPPVVASLVTLGHGAILVVTENRLASVLFVVTASVGAFAVRHLVVTYHGMPSWFFQPPRATH